MADIVIEGAEVRIVLTTLEQIAGLSRGPRTAAGDIVSVDIVQDPVASSSGLRAPGLAIPGRTRIGTWRRRHNSTFVAVRHDQPAVRVALRGGKHDEWLVSVADAEATQERLRAAMG